MLYFTLRESYLVHRNVLQGHCRITRFFHFIADTSCLKIAKSSTCHVGTQKRSPTTTREGPNLLQSEVTYPNFSYPNASVIRTCSAKPHPVFLVTFVNAKLFKWQILSVSGLALPVVEHHTW